MGSGSLRVSVSEPTTDKSQSGQRRSATPLEATEHLRLMATVLLCPAVQWIVWTDPASGPRGERSTWRQRLVALKGVWGVTVLFIVAMGGIYGGVFTATEGAGIGA